MRSLADVAFDAISTSFFFDHELPSSNLLVSVILPARNEEYHLAASLDALRLQKDDKGDAIPADTYEVLLLINNCTDGTEDVATNYQQRWPDFALRISSIELSPKDAHIGKVRRILMDEACHRFNLIGNKSGIIASTDSDSCVDGKWLQQIMLEVNNGADAVGGRILTNEPMGGFMSYQRENDNYRNLVARVESIIDPQDYDPWPRHFQYFGANMAVTKSAYEAVGGIPALRFLEDNALYDSLFKNDAKIRMSPEVKVTTSCRTEGRVEIGFSEQLKKWSEMHDAGHHQRVPSGEEIVTLLNLKRRLRNCWAESKVLGRADRYEATCISNDLMLDADWLINEIVTTRYFGGLWLKVESERPRQHWNALYPSVIIADAIRFLERFIG